MNIRRAKRSDTETIHRLLLQVAQIHHQGRPDLFRPGTKKYSEEELLKIIEDDSRPVFVAEEPEGAVLGYAFCIFQQYMSSLLMTDIKTLYIDDLCVDKDCRGKGVGRALYEAVVAFARQKGCYNVTLNVWSCNTAAMKFYESCGLKPQKVGMETILR